MKVYTLLEINHEDFEVEISLINCYCDYDKALNEMMKLKKDNMLHYDYVLDDENEFIIFRGSKENWMNYIEYKIEENEVK